MSSSLRDTLQAIYDERGALTPRVVVDAAADEDHPLHDRLEWDDAIAGDRYRLVQAQEMIRSVRVVYRKPTGKSRDDGTVRYWHAIRGEDGYSYEPADVVANDPVLTQILMMDMKREWKSLQARYGAFAEFVQMVRKDVA